MENGKAAENESLLHRYEHDENSSRYFVNISDDVKQLRSIEQRQQRMINLLPTLFCFFFVILAWCLNEIALAWIHERVPSASPPLPDLWFSTFPEIRGAIRITEYIMIVLVVNAVIVMATHQHRWFVIRRALFCIALSYTFRALCITILQVPVPSIHTYCAPKSNSSSLPLVMGRVSKMFWSAGIEQLRPRELCGDLLVSGHTLIIFSAFLVFKTYAPRKLRILAHIYHVMVFVALAAILFARKHYTLDVVLGYTVASRVFMEYHSLAVSFHENRLYENPLSWSCWTWFVEFLETDAPAPQNFHNHLSLSFNYVSKKPQRSFE